MASLKSLSVCVVAGLMGLSAVSPALAQLPGATTWDAKYDPTGESKNPTPVTVSIGAEGISVTSKAGALVSVPRPSVTAVSYDTRSQRRTKEGAILMAASPIGGLLLARSKKTQHFVTIESTARQPLVLELGKEEYAGFLGAMRDLTGREWTDHAKARLATQEELRAAKSGAIDIRLDRQVVVNGVALKPGRYQVVLLARPGSTGELHFFSGRKVDVEASVANVTVSVASGASAGKLAEVSYSQTGAAASVSAIRTPASILLFPS